MEFNQKDYPGLFLASDSLSLTSQKNFFKVLTAYLILLPLATLPSYFYDELKPLTSIFIFLSLLCSIYLLWSKPEQSWYSGRAVAESIKTLTWRFITKAEPFYTDNLLAENHFRNTLNEIVNQNKEIAKRLLSNLEDQQITSKMREIRDSSFENRKNFYVENRIKEQRNWYAKKARNNSSAHTLFFSILIGLTIIALVLSVIHFFNLSIQTPIDTIVALTGSFLTWLQTKRFSELSASYSLAAHEINLINEKAVSILDEKNFSTFVADAENAFSREHTQWAARRDV